MKHEFKVTKSKDQTVYTLESASVGSSSTAGGASVSTALGGVRKRGDNLLAQEADKKKVPATTPRNFVAKNAKTSGAGAHADKKKAAKQGDVKHKSRAMDMAEDKEDKIAQLKKDHETAVHWSKNETSPQKREAARQKAEKIKRHLDTQYKQGVAEDDAGDVEQRMLAKMEKEKQRLAKLKQTDPEAYKREMAKRKTSGSVPPVSTFEDRGVAEGEKKPHPETWHDVDPKLGRAVDKMSQAEKVKKGLAHPDTLKKKGVAEAEKKGLYYYVNKRKKAGTSRDASSPKAPTAQAWKDAAKTAKKESVGEDHEIQMASSELQAIAKNALRLLDLVRKYSEQEGLEAWQQSKITKSADYLNSVLQSISGEQSNLEDHSNFGNGWGQGGYDTYAGTRHGRGVAEGSSDFVGDSIEALRMAKPGLEQEDFLDELYMYIENQYGQRAAEMMSNAGQDDFDEWYDSYTDMAETAPKGWEKTVKAMKKHDEIDNPWALAHYMKGKGYKSHKEDAYMAELAAKIAEKLDPNADVDVWIQDFQKADPNKYRQFKNKTPEKKAQMATSARYAAKNPSKK